MSSRFFFALYLLAGVLLCGITIGASGVLHERPEIRAKNRSIVYTDRGCSGFVFAPGIVATAGHCVSDGAMPHPTGTPFQIRFEVPTADGGSIFSSRSFKLLKASYGNGLPDFALLGGPTGEAEPLPVDMAPPEYGDGLAFIGYGGLHTGYQHATAGLFCKICKDTVGVNNFYFEFAAEVQHGDSGSPLINFRGEVIGIVVRSIEAYSIGEATPILYAVQTLRELSSGGK